MKRRPAEPTTPVERHDTIRKKIIAILIEREVSARELSAELMIPEREICDHLEHIKKTINKGEHHLKMTPARCDHCGFVFKKRERLKRPGKCPLCRSQLIREPIYSISRR